MDRAVCDYRLEAVNTVLIDRDGAPAEVARAVLTSPTVERVVDIHRPPRPRAPFPPPVPRPSGPQARTQQPRWSCRDSLTRTYWPTTTSLICITGLRSV